MKAEYIWTPRAQVRVDAHIAAHELKRLAKKGEVTARTVVEAARPEDAPLHPAFEWDDSVAAELHRAEQARLMLRSIRVLRGPEQEPERVFWHVETQEVDSYVTTARVMSEPELREALMASCVTTLIATRKRYAELKELAPVWEVIDELALATV